MGLDIGVLEKAGAKKLVNKKTGVITIVVPTKAALATQPKRPSDSK
jgi:hypothetical protein